MVKAITPNLAFYLMSGNEFVEKIKKLGKKWGVQVTIDETRCKGSHRSLYFGDKNATIPNLKKELKKGIFHAILKQLGISKDDLNGV